MEREKVGAHLREIIDEKTEAWGIKATAVEIRDVIIPGNLQDAMSRQAQAERERMARDELSIWKTKKGLMCRQFQPVLDLLFA